jgi:ribosomal protein L9
MDANAKISEVFGEEGATVAKKAGPDGSLFGSVTSTEVGPQTSRALGPTCCA